ncbi:MAG: sensor histidine kinase [Gallionella sp.]|nr:sensor histidine kinase [Gallionella sp.]
MYVNSLHRQLLKRLLWPLVIILLTGSIFAYFFALRAAINAYDLGLLNDAFDISKQVEIHQGVMSINLPPAARQMLRMNNNDRVEYAAWDESGRIFSGEQKLLQVNALASDEDRVFRDITLNGEVHRAVLLREKVEGQTYFLVVAQTVHGRDHLTGGIFAGILIPETLLAIVSIAVILLGVRRGLSPVEHLRDEITRRSSSDLRAIEESTAPAELAPIIHGINELLGNLATAFASHRRFIADAAHQLRTPLAALSSQIEVAMDEPPADGQALLGQLLTTTQRTTHLANQLLSLARLEHTEQSMYEVASVELHEVLRSVAADFVSMGVCKEIELNFELQSARVSGSPLMLRELISNLLDNSIRYTPTGGLVTVTTRVMDKNIWLVIEDNGPGVPLNAIEKLGTPFYRLPSGHSEGCGLGLAIVREICRLHGAELFFSSRTEGYGFQVRVRFHSPS